MGLFWRGITHDLSKLLPSEFFPYANFFYTDDEDRGKEKIEKDFDIAWLLHQKRNPHHWQYWILNEDDGKIKIMDMPEKYRKEMLCDWRGAGRAIKRRLITDETKEWYVINKDKMQLHPGVRRWIENKLL